MSQAGTLLSDLGGSPGNDNDLVQQILADMNTSPSNPVVQSNNPMSQGSPTPPMGHRAPMMNAQNPQQTTYHQAADPAAPTAHMIGRSHPTEADFNRMMMSGSLNSPGPGQAPFVPMQPQMQQMQQMQQPVKNWQAEWADEFKLPLLVAIVCLLLTLPAINLLVSHYAPVLLRPGGDFNTYGLVARALSAGLLFWFLQRIVAPLVL